MYANDLLHIMYIQRLTGPWPKLCSVCGLPTTCASLVYPALHRSEGNNYQKQTEKTETTTRANKIISVPTGSFLFVLRTLLHAEYEMNWQWFRTCGSSSLPFHYDINDFMELNADYDGIYQPHETSQTKRVQFTLKTLKHLRNDCS